MGHAHLRCTVWCKRLCLHQDKICRLKSCAASCGSHTCRAEPQGNTPKPGCNMVRWGLAFSCCILPFSVSLSFKSASIRVSSSFILSLCPHMLVQHHNSRGSDVSILTRMQGYPEAAPVSWCYNVHGRTCFRILLPWILPTMRPVVAPVATKGRASCACGGNLRYVSTAVFFTDNMKGLRKSTSTCTA